MSQKSRCIAVGTASSKERDKVNAKFCLSSISIGGTRECKGASRSSPALARQLSAVSDVFVDRFSQVQMEDLLLYCGNWSCLRWCASADAIPSGKVTLSWLGTQVFGHVLRAGKTRAEVSCMIAGAQVALLKRFRPRCTTTTEAGLPVKESYLQVSETLASSTQSVLRGLTNWTRMEKRPPSC